MSSGGAKTNVATYDPSEYEAEIQNKRMELTDRITKKAFGAAKEANVYADHALDSLNEGLGLLSNYLSDVTQKERTNLVLSESAIKKGNKVRAASSAGAGMLMGAMETYMKQAQKYDKSNTRG